MAALGFRSSLKFFERFLFTGADKSIKFSHITHRNTLLVRGIKRLPRKKDKRDGHSIKPRDYFWEQRMNHEPKSPLATEPVNIIANSTARANTTTFTLAEKRLAAMAVIMMLTAVISFKLTFGSKRLEDDAEDVLQDSK